MNNSTFLLRNNKTIINDLIQELAQIPIDWVLTPVLSEKAPYRKSWQHELPLSRDIIAKDINKSIAKGYAIRTGIVSGGIMAVDADGESAHQKILEFSGGEKLPQTVAFTSGKQGRCQYLLKVPSQYWNIIKTIKFKTGVIGNDGKEELLELRWDGCASILPPSLHPETGIYYWVTSPNVSQIAPAPMWIIERMSKDVATRKNKLKPQSTHKFPFIPLEQQNSKSTRLSKSKREGKLGWEDTVYLGIDTYTTPAQDRLSNYSKQHNYQHQESLLSPNLNTSAFLFPPLEIFLTRNDRELIEFGTHNGTRNDAARKLSINLVATTRRLDQLGISYQGDSKYLYDLFCSRCTPPLGSDVKGQDLNWWYGAQSKAALFTPSLDDYTLKNRELAWTTHYGYSNNYC